MSLSSSTRRNDATGDGNTSTYSYTFPILAESELAVYVADTDGVEASALVLTTDYTVAGEGESSGGSISLVSSGQAWLTAGGKLKSGYHITILGNTPKTQATSIRNGGTYYPATVENQFDKTTKQIQELAEQLGRTLKLKRTNTTTGMEIEEALVAESTLVVNDDADGFVMGPTLSSIAADKAAASASASAAASSASSASTSATAAASSASAAATSATAAASSASAAAASASEAALTAGTPKKQFSLSGVFGTDTVYTLAQTPITDSLLVFLDGILQNDYTLSTNTVTFVGVDTTAQAVDVYYRY